MSLEQLMILASQLAQAPRLPKGEGGDPHFRAAPRRASAELSPEELEALSQIWSHPPRSQMAQPSGRVHH